MTRDDCIKEYQLLLMKVDLVGKELTHSLQGHEFNSHCRRENLIDGVIRKYSLRALNYYFVTIEAQE